MFVLSSEFDVQRSELKKRLTPNFLLAARDAQQCVVDIMAHLLLLSCMTFCHPDSTGRVLRQPTNRGTRC